MHENPMAGVADEQILQFIGDFPGRWGRMDKISRLTVIEVGKILGSAGLIAGRRHLLPDTFRIGLVVGSRRGSLGSDLAFMASMQEDFRMASPALFGYTLPSISLAEAACHFGLRGPVYSLLHYDQAGQQAEREAEFWLFADQGLNAMIWGNVDCYPSTTNPNEEIVTAKLHLMEK